MNRIALSIAAFAAFTAIASADNAASRAPEGPTTNIRLMDWKYQENELKADTSYRGKPVSWELFVGTVRANNGKPFVETSIRFNDNAGGTYFCNAQLDPKAFKTAMDLKPGDRLRVSGIFSKREVFSKDEVQIGGYIGGSYNGSGGGGSINGGTVTRSWTIYTLKGCTVKVLQTEAQRLQEVQKENLKKEQREALWADALKTLDNKKAEQALAQGIPASYVDGVIQEIGRRDPGLANYDALVDFYDWAIRQPGVNWGQALGSVYQTPRPKLFRVLLKNGVLNYKFKYPNGDNVLHFMLKDYTLYSNMDRPSSELRISFTDSWAEMIEILCADPKAKGLADEKDAFGKTPKDYMKGRFIGEYESSSNNGKVSIFQRIRNAVMAN